MYILFFNKNKLNVRQKSEKKFLSYFEIAVANFFYLVVLIVFPLQSISGGKYEKKKFKTKCTVFVKVTLGCGFLVGVVSSFHSTNPILFYEYHIITVLTRMFRSLDVCITQS